MKDILSIKLILILAGIILFLTTCIKDEDFEQLRKESITNILNNEISSDSLRTSVTWMQNIGTRFALSDNHRDIAVKIRNRFKIAGYPDACIDSFMIIKTYNNITYQQWQYNVIASITGRTYPDSVCLVGGHYDNILKTGTGNPLASGYGANDNASGVAAAIEIARVMKKANYSPRNTIRFIAYGAEELGLFGSYYQSGKSKSGDDKIKIMLNNDMIAYSPSVNKAEWYVNIIDYENSHNIRKIAESMAERYTELKYVNINTSSKQSDSYPYFVNGFRALFFTSNTTDPNYHTPGDIAANCNFEYCREIVKISCAMLVEAN